MADDHSDLNGTRTVILIENSEGPEIDMPALLESGWRYQDITWIGSEYWDYFIAALGERGVDYHILAETRSPEGNMRGQIVFSPKAVDNIAAYRALHPMPGARLDA